MCGRFVLNINPAMLEAHFDLEQSCPAFLPSFNIPPGSDVPVIWQKPGDGRACSRMHWGLIPHWSRTTTSKYKMINARAESLRDKPAYRDAFRKRRCLIPTTGFYEWHETAHGKQPYFIGGREKQLFAFAGLWEYWEGEHTLNSFTIVTTIANKMIASIHERMPVILAPADYQRWLEVENQTEDELDDLLMPVDLDWLELYPVDTAVNSPRHDSADLLERKADLFR